MTPPDWASQRVEKVSSDGFSGDAWAVRADECARLLRLEHARAVRTVKRRLEALKGQREVATTEYAVDGLRLIIEEVEHLLTDLQRGRTQKGTR